MLRGGKHATLYVAGRADFKSGSDLTRQLNDLVIFDNTHTVTNPVRVRRLRPVSVL